MNWHNVAMYAACLAGVDASYMQNAGAPQAQDASDIVPETQGARKSKNGEESTNVVFGPGRGLKNGGQAPINPNGDSPTPGTWADGAGYIANLMQCIANVRNNF
jgi:hypothetical protein